MTEPPSFYLGAWRPVDGVGQGGALHLPMHHLVTHGVIAGMTGCGKTGLLTVLVEEALRARIPVLVIDVKGDLPNLLLAFPNFDASSLVSWIDAPTDGRSVESIAAELAEQRRAGLAAWSLGEPELVDFVRTSRVRIVTPGSSAGEPLHVLSSLERPSPRWQDDPDSARAALSAAVSLVLRLLGRDPDPARAASTCSSPFSPSAACSRTNPLISPRSSRTLRIRRWRRSARSRSTHFSRAAIVASSPRR